MTTKSGLPYALVEHNDGGLTLFVFSDPARTTAVYACTGLEHDDPETVAKGLCELAGGDNPFRGNASDDLVLEDPQAAWDDVDFAEVVATDERLHPRHMGPAARRALRVPLYAAALEEIRGWDGRSIWDLEALFYAARRLAPQNAGRPDTHELDEVALTLSRLDRDNVWPNWDDLIAVAEDGGFLAWDDEEWTRAGYLLNDNLAA